MNPPFVRKLTKKEESKLYERIDEEWVDYRDGKRKMIMGVENN